MQPPDHSPLPAQSPPTDTQGNRRYTLLIAMLLMVVATIALSSMHGLVRHASTQMNIFTIVFFRNLFGLLAVAPLVMRNGARSLQTQRFGLHAIRAFTGVFAMLLWFQALATVPIATATALSFSAAIFTTIAAALFLAEKVRTRRIVAIVAGLAGVLIVLRPASDSFNSYALLVLLSTMFWGTSVVIVKSLSSTEQTASIVAWNAILLTLLSLPFALWAQEWPTLAQLLPLLAIGALGTIGHLCMVGALARADSTAVMSLDFLRLIWTIAIGYWFFADQTDVWTITGAMVIFSSGVYILFRESRLRHQSGTR